MTPHAQFFKDVSVRDIRSFTYDVATDTLSIDLAVVLDRESGSNIETTVDIVVGDLPDDASYLPDAIDHFTEMCRIAVKRDVAHSGEPPCKTCMANCCRGPRVLITEEEWDQLRAVVNDRIADAIEELPTPTLGYVAALPQYEHGDCMLLLPSGACGVYDERPGMCREWDYVGCDMYSEAPSSMVKQRKYHLTTIH